jgi:hypothetical protein
MKKIIALSAAALLGSSLIAAPALAQVSVGGSGGAGVTVGGSDGNGGVSVGGTAGAGATTGTDGTGIKLGADGSAATNLDTNSTAAIGADFDGALSAMARGGDSAATIGSMTQVSSVNVVKIDGMAGADMDAFTKAETDNMAGIEDLRASLDANAAVKAALDAQSIDSEDVVAADVAADGSLTVFVR